MTSIGRRTSTATSRAPYLRNDFFENPDMIFWENEKYSERAKEHLRKIAFEKISSAKIKKK